jgi:homoserine dehydrogenase
VSHDILGWQSLNEIPNCNTDNIDSIFYLRLLATDKPGVLADITSTLAKHNISIESVIQKQIDQQNNAHIAIITNRVKTAELNAAIAEIQTREFNQETVKVIHVENFN